MCPCMLTVLPQIIPHGSYCLCPDCTACSCGLDPNCLLSPDAQRLNAAHAPGGIVLSPASYKDSFPPAAGRGPWDGRDAGGGGGVTIGPTPMDWKLFIVQEFCDGGTLQAAITRGWFHVGSQVGEGRGGCGCEWGWWDTWV